jgi:transcriptional regulator with XRE-family HTH domain
MAKINEKIKYYRELRGIGIGELALVINVPYSNIKSFEEGTLMPSLQVLKRISEALDIDYKELDIKEDKKEMVDHPKHYNMGKYEAIDVIEDWNLNFNLGNAVKYISRAGHKDDIVQDLKKSLWYIDREIQRLKNK